MFLPLTTDRPLSRPTLVNHVLIGLNVAAYAVTLISRATDARLFERLLDLLVLTPGKSGFWTYVTYAFLHDFNDILHIVGNMLFLWVFGPNVEDRLGRVGYLAFYLVGAVAAALTQTLFAPASMIGASGAVAAVTGAYLVLFPRTHIRTFVFFFLIGVFMIPAAWFIGAKVFMDFVLVGRSDNVARWAHIGGYLYGAAVAMVLLWTHVLPREPYDLFTIGRQAHRRRQFREADFAARRSRDAGEGVHRPAGKRKIAAELPGEAVDGRARVVRLVADGDFGAAGRAYRALLDAYGNLPAAGRLGRRPQLELCKGLFSAGDHAMAGVACERFLDAYPTDAEGPSIKLMLGLINARYLNDPVRAKALVSEAEGEVRTDDERRLAAQLLAELG